MNVNQILITSDRSFYPIFNKRFDHSEALLTIHRPKTFLSAGSLCGLLVSSPLLKCSKKTVILPQTYHGFRLKYVVIAT